MKVEQDEAYILHRRPFKESSIIAECFCRKGGWVSCIARGVKRARSRLDARLQPFIPLQLEWGGRGELKTLFKAETTRFYANLKKEKLFIGLYLNELMIRLLQRGDPYPVLYELYEKTLENLSNAAIVSEIQGILRRFEVDLLAQLGYGLELWRDTKGSAIEAELVYSYDPRLGIYEISGGGGVPRCVASGTTLLALRNNAYPSEGILVEAKKFMRFVLSHYLGNKPLETRKLFYSASDK